MTVKKTIAIDKLTFEQALGELEEIVSNLEAGAVGLDEAMEIYTRGQKLKEYCANKLAAARLQVEKITVENGGNPSVSPFDADA